MKYSHIVPAFYCEPWHLRPDIHASFGRLLVEHMKGREIEGVAHQRTALPYADCGKAGRQIVGPIDTETGQPYVPQMEVFGSIAIIPVQGVLGKKLSMLDLYCGGCDYAHISEFIEMAASDPEIKSVIFDFDSPGGQAKGAPECAEQVAKLSAIKSTIAFTDGMLCSAAYFLGSQCGEILATRTSTVGSIGTILAVVDSSRQWEIEGLKLELFASGPLKATGADGKPFTDADRAYLQERMEQADSWIKDAVRKGRPSIAEEALQGQWFYGQFALGLGVIDAVAEDLDAVITAAMASV
jgi:signal peptide peptidase SppA